MREPRRSLSLFAIAACAALACACGDPEYRAHLDDGSGLKAGAPVFVSGLEVGKVKSVTLQGDAVEVTFTVQRQHQLVLHADACALALPVRDQGSLYVRPGSQGALEKGAPLPQCHLLGDAIRSAVKEVGGAVNEAIDALVSRLAPPAPGAAPCGKVSLRLTASKAADSEPGQRVQLEVDNPTDAKVSFPSVSSAKFLDAGGQELEVATQSGGSLWFMPFSVNAHAKSSVGVQFVKPGAKPASVELDLGFGLLNSCRLHATLEGP